MWNDVFMTYLNSPNYTLYNKKKQTPNKMDVCLNIILLVLKWLFKATKKCPTLKIEHLISKNSYNGYYFETATEKKAEHT